MQGFFPTISINSNNRPGIAYQSWGLKGSDLDLKFAAFSGVTWDIETVYDDSALGVGYPSSSLDYCDNPHISFYVYTDNSVKYATKGEPCPPKPKEEPSVSLDIDPNTLNLKSKGRWITAYLTAENASIEDIDLSSILLQDSLTPERYDYQDDILMLKFSRQEFMNTIEVGESIEVKISGKWEHGEDFEAFDTIRVIDPGKG